MIKFTPQESLNIAGGFVAAGLIIVLAFVTWALVYHELPKANESAFLVLIGILSGNIGTVVSYFFGSSVSTKKQTEAIADMAKNAASVGNVPPEIINLPPGASASVSSTPAGTEIKPEP